MGHHEGLWGTSERVESELTQMHFDSIRLCNIFCGILSNFVTTCDINWSRNDRTGHPVVPATFPVGMHPHKIPKMSALLSLVCAAHVATEKGTGGTS